MAPDPTCLAARLLPSHPCLAPQQDLAEAHKADPVEPSMTPEELTEVEKVFKDF